MSSFKGHPWDQLSRGQVLRCGREVRRGGLFLREVSGNPSRGGHHRGARTGRVRGPGRMRGPEALVWHEEMSDIKADHRFSFPTRLVLFAFIDVM